MYPNQMSESQWIRGLRMMAFGYIALVIMIPVAGLLIFGLSLLLMY